MNIWIHSQLSAKKFGGQPEVYYHVHKFLDASKLFYFHIKHRILLHNTFGIELCTRLFGDCIELENGQKILVRDIAAEHIKEDLSGKIPTIFDWLGKNAELEKQQLLLPKIDDEEISLFMEQPFLQSGLTASRIITYSDFGIYLIQELFGPEKAAMVRAKIPPEQNVANYLRHYKFTQKWQFSPDMSQLNLLQSDERPAGKKVE
ncbi:MAG: hypothetical protein R2824_19645 [Saprospiraceae bacterium]|nr:hypothetical protein [Lewinella sp.]